MEILGIVCVSIVAVAAWLHRLTASWSTLCPVWTRRGQGVQQYPVYRLEGGKVVVQEFEGARWTALDMGVANAMLGVFNGLSLETIHNTVMAAADGTDQGFRQVA